MEIRMHSNMYECTLIYRYMHAYNNIQRHSASEKQARVELQSLELKQKQEGEAKAIEGQNALCRHTPTREMAQRMRPPSPIRKGVSSVCGDVASAYAMVGGNAAIAIQNCVSFANAV